MTRKRERRPMDQQVLTLHFGALVPRIEEQLNELGLRLNRPEYAHSQFDADAITRLAVSGLLSDGQVASARRKLVRRIAHQATRIPKTEVA
jgi:hypothetical protein